MNEEILKGIICALLDIIDHGVPEIGHKGSCGPESCCDGICVEVANCAQTIQFARKAIA
jgi:hypothetical protein